MNTMVEPVIVANTIRDIRPGIVLDPKEAFDSVGYLVLYPEVQAAGIDPWLHFVHHGDEEGRSPIQNFDATWYANHVGIGDRPKGAFDHFCAVGNFLAIPTNRDDYDKALSIARSNFDEKFYLEKNPDVEKAGIDPWAHFINYGAFEGRDPSGDFNAAWYLNQYVTASLANPAHVSLCNVLLHYHLVGKERSFDTSPRALSPIGEVIFAEKNKKSDSIGSLIAYAASLAAKKIGARAVVPPMSIDASEIYHSSLFQTRYYSSVSKIDAPRDVLVDHYLSEGAEKGLDPSPDFSTEFYRKYYEKLPDSIKHLEIHPATPALLHYIRLGRNYGFYPNPQVASLEIEEIRASGRFRVDYYLGQLGRKPVIKDLVADYAFYGHVEGVNPSADFDVRFVQALYRPVCQAQFHEPLAFTLRSHSSIWVFTSPAALQAEADAVRASSEFDAEVYAKNAGIEMADVDPAEHFVTFGLKNAIPASRTFDTEFYLTTYPDLAKVRINPLLHFDKHGRGEGRTGTSEVILQKSAAKRAHDFGRSTAIVCTHEFSRTGAPIVALNLARKLV